MKTYFESKFKVDVTIVEQGEYFVSSKGEIITTTLGSCVAVCIFDAKSQVGGLNHFMLPEPLGDQEDPFFAKAKYGVHSMEVLINEILKAGGWRANLEAKVFGGANMFGNQIKSREAGIPVGEQNVAFAKKYLDLEGIAITKIDVGGERARKIYFDSKNGFVKLFRIGADEKIKEQEILYHKSIYKPSLAETKIKKEEEGAEEGKDKKITFF